MALKSPSVPTALETRKLEILNRAVGEEKKMLPKLSGLCYS